MQPWEARVISEPQGAPSTARIALEDKTQRAGSSQELPALCYCETSMTLTAN